MCKDVNSGACETGPYAAGALTCSVVIATLGRPAAVANTVSFLAKQTRQPRSVVLVCPRLQDVGEAAYMPGVRVLISEPGLAHQRNVALASLENECDIVVFFDDDFVAHPTWLDVVVGLFEKEPGLAALTGKVLADGIKGPGISFQRAVEILEAAHQCSSSSLIEPFSPYGCNMAFRSSAVNGLRFDERLVLYGWLEDRDFGGSLAKRGGRLAKTELAVGVHLGSKGGRMGGERLGYSQVANPLYMVRKGTMTYPQFFKHISGNVISNILKSVWPEAYIDRRGRLRGNMLAFADVISGNCYPEKAAVILQNRKPS